MRRMSEARTTVRTATPADLPLWKDLRLRSLADVPDAFGSTLAREQGFTEEDWQQRISPPSYLGFLDGEPVALGGGFADGGILQVVAMWTAPAARGHGLARMILDRVVAWARERDLPVQLDVTIGNGPAETAYERYGFVATGETEPLRPGSAVRVARMVLP